MQSSYSETFFLSAGETNAEQEMSLPLLVAKLIDIATTHANSLGIGNPSMEHINAGWVLSRLTVEMTEYPSVNESYTLTTWIESFNKHFSVRDFKISSPDGAIVYGYARSVWMVMSTIDHSNVGLSHLTLPEGVNNGEPAPIDKQARHVPIVTELNDDAPKGAIVATAPPFDYRFKYCDLDSYRHVNTVRYVVLLLNRFSLEEHDESLVSRLELSFMHEARYGMETRLLRSDSEDGKVSSFQLSDKADGTNLFFARLFRSPRRCQNNY